MNDGVDVAFVRQWHAYEWHDAGVFIRRWSKKVRGNFRGREVVIGFAVGGGLEFVVAFGDERVDGCRALCRNEQASQHNHSQQERQSEQQGAKTRNARGFFQCSWSTPRVRRYRGKWR